MPTSTNLSTSSTCGGLACILFILAWVLTFGCVATPPVHAQDDPHSWPHHERQYEDDAYGFSKPSSFTKRSVAQANANYRAACRRVRDAREDAVELEWQRRRVDEKAKVFCGAPHDYRHLRAVVAHELHAGNATYRGLINEIIILRMRIDGVDRERGYELATKLCELRRKAWVMVHADPELSQAFAEFERAGQTSQVAYGAAVNAWKADEAYIEARQAAHEARAARSDAKAQAREARRTATTHRVLRLASQPSQTASAKVRTASSVRRPASVRSRSYPTTTTRRTYRVRHRYVTYRTTYRTFR